jgi:MerR family transcriptional regulator, thiopeptide resistance regulator
VRTVKEVAELAGVTVRTLHHYDEIGLLRPSRRSDAGYRLYDRADLQRLQQILLWRALGFGLADVERLLDEPGLDRPSALAAQRAALAERLEELTGLLEAVDDAIAEETGGRQVDEAEMFDAFEREHADEARERWGDTDAYRQSAARVGALTAEDKRRLVQDGEAFVRRLAEAFTSGVPADSPAAMDLAEEARRSIDAQFYDCSKEVHVSLGEMYVEDPRFTAYYDRHAEGLARWFRDAIVANAAR